MSKTGRRLAVTSFSVMLIALASLPVYSAPPPTLTVGSKAFPESIILGEMVAHLVRDAGVQANHDRTRGLGGTQVLWRALLKGDIDVYADYTGTIALEILSDAQLQSEDEMRKALAAQGIRMSRSLGFNDGYAIGMKSNVAEHLGIRRISDLRKHPELKFGFSNEFMKRQDGWPGLQKAYSLPQQDVRGLQHDLAYQALASGAIDATELYTTDAEIRSYGLRVLEDDRHYFPKYLAVLLYRADLDQRAQAAVEAFLKLQGAVTESTMIDMNAQVKLHHASPSQVAADFVNARFRTHAVAQELGFCQMTVQHLWLVGTSLGAAVILAIPLGVLGFYWPRLGQVVLIVTGIVQTIPSLALLVLLVPLVGLGATPAILALFLYSLLPIVRDTYTGLQGIPPQIRESAAALGLPTWAQLWRIDLPLASRSILAGIKTSAVINVGTATLGGFIGAGGYGQAIFTGIPLNNWTLVLEGAIPAAVLAIVVQGVFDLSERFAVPRGLRLKAAT